jgi:hypothetical protein
MTCGRARKHGYIQWDEPGMYLYIAWTVWIVGYSDLFDLFMCKIQVPFIFFKINLTSLYFCLNGEEWHRGIIVFLVYQSVCPVVEIGSLNSTPSLRSPPLDPGGEQHSLASGGPNSDGRTESLAICKLCAPRYSWEEEKQTFREADMTIGRQLNRQT